jgi:hypothetical protein
MLPAVELDYQPCFEAHEIDDIGADDLLPPEFEAEELTVAQMLPEQSLSIGLLDTQSAREQFHHYRRLSDLLIPSL